MVEETPLRLLILFLQNNAKEKLDHLDKEIILKNLSVC